MTFWIFALVIINVMCFLVIISVLLYLCWFIFLLDESLMSRLRG